MRTNSKSGEVTFNKAETEIVELRDFILSEKVANDIAAKYALAALAPKDRTADFVEHLSNGKYTIDKDGKVIDKVA